MSMCRASETGGAPAVRAAGFDSEQPPRGVIEQLLHNYAFAATRYILAKTKEFAERNGKKLLVLVFDRPAFSPLVEGKSRYDQVIVDYLRERQFLFFDMNLVHAGGLQKLPHILRPVHAALLHRPLQSGR